MALLEARKHWDDVGHSFHDMIMMDLELGWRVTVMQECEDIGFGPLFDAQYEEDKRLGKI